MLSPSVHQMAAHPRELFELTLGLPIAKFSEQAGEGNNKYVGHFNLVWPRRQNNSVYGTIRATFSMD